MRGHLGHQGGRRHAGLGVDFQPDQLALGGGTVIETKVGSADAPATDCLMRLQSECLYFLVNIW
ncbi:hypothetical protein D3C87_2054810 [compost metagenome]